MLKYDVLIIMERLDPSIKYWDDKKRSYSGDKKRSAEMTRRWHWYDKKCATFMTPFQ
ncbi:MAG: hypothetical protein ACR5LB_05030 [Wolbachia sp.]